MPSSASDKRIRHPGKVFRGAFFRGIKAVIGCISAVNIHLKQLREKAPWCKVVVGGAVLTQEYADKIGADKYAKDAMETVRYAEEIV